MTADTEVWKDIRDFESLYQVSNLGKIKHLHYNSKKGLNNQVVIKDTEAQTKNNRGYCCIKSDKKDCRIEIMVHKAVAQAFPEICGEWFEGCIVHHKDGNKLNNNATNLIVLTKEEHRQIHSNDGVTYKKISEKLKGKKFSEEHIQHIKDALKNVDRTGENNAFFGKHHSEETKEKIRKANTGKHPSEESRKKMSDSNGRKRKVAAYKDGVFVKDFTKIKEGAAYFKLHPQNISAALRGITKHCGPYEWRYVS